MADKNDWRAERAAQLAGTPFARPATEPRLEDTLPINSAWVSPKTVAAKLAPPARRGPMYGVIAVAAALIAAIVGFLIVRHDRRQEVAVSAASTPLAPARTTPPAPVAVSPATVPSAPAIAPSAPVVAPSAPIVEAPEAPIVAAPVVEKMRRPVVRERKVRAAPAAKPTPAKHTGKKPRRARTRTVAPSAVPSPTQEAAVIDDTPDVRPAPRRASRPPVCQPGVFNRAARPCRPSHDRVVRKPYYAK